jgi:hypothetical protein
MKIFLDDLRDTPPGWVRCFWPQEVIELLKTQTVEEVSLDHDLGDDQRGTGYDVIRWIEQQVYLQGYVPPRIQVHSANPAARERMLLGIEAINRYRHQ